MPRIGIIGLGRISGLHARAYAAVPDAELAALCDTNPATLEEQRRAWGVEKGFADYRDLLADPDIDAVEILTPQPLHEPMVIAAAEAGKHIAVQKPMATSMESAARMLDAVRRAGVVFKVTDNYPFYPPLVLAKRFIDDGRIGTPQVLRMKFVGGVWEGGWTVPEETWAWRREEARQGRGLQTFDHGHHLWATALRLLGPVERVHAWVDQMDGFVDCPAVISWKHAAPRRYGICDYSQALRMPIPTQYYACDEWFEVQGDAGLVVVRRCTGELRGGPSVRLYADGAWQDCDEPSDWALGFTGALANFVQAIRGAEEPLLSGKQAADVLRFAFALRRSSDEGREVRPDEI